ncbi:MAG: septal ring lytic transglycosylase RlpA family protein [Deltaproteobacteria bacterium]|nr:septal ring lytic transglycosylase RlpA family protein [Deltaproteobacteria bacterium]
MKSLRQKTGLIILVVLTISLCACGVIRTTYDVTSGTVKAAYKTTKFAVKAGVGTLRLTYKIGKFTFHVIDAPLNWPMTTRIDSVAGLSPREAIREGKVKDSPYVVRGRRYRPMSVAQAANYREEGIASWYGEETRRQKGGAMTADGEVFNPALPTAAHKYLPLPTHVRVTNLENGRSIIVRVNDRGPFVRGRIIDLSAGAARQLGYLRQGTTRVLVETVKVI